MLCMLYSFVMVVGDIIMSWMRTVGRKTYKGEGGGGGGGRERERDRQTDRQAGRQTIY